MATSGDRWATDNLRRLRRLGAPANVIARWRTWLAACELPPPKYLLDWLAEQLDDPESPMPDTYGSPRWN